MVGKIVSNSYRTVLLALVAAAGQRHTRSLKADFHFLATNSSFHNVWAESVDVYLVEVVVGKREALPALLVDQFPDDGEPLSQDILTAPADARLRLSRDSSCDIEIAKIRPLRTALGDPTSVLGEKLVLTPQLSLTLTPETILPCYRVVR